MDTSRQNSLYAETTALMSPALQRLARAYEADPDRRRDLLQEIHLELWRSFAAFDHRCSVRTWVYRVAHNVGISHITRSRRYSALLVDLETVQPLPAAPNPTPSDELSSLYSLIYRLRPLDRQTILLYLEGETASDISEATGLTTANVATRIHRIKKLLRQEYGASEGNR